MNLTQSGTTQGMATPLDLASEAALPRWSHPRFVCLFFLCFLCLFAAIPALSELEPDRSLLGPVRDDRFELPLIRIRVYLNEAEMIDVRLGSNPLHIVRLDVFNRDHILSPILEVAKNDEFAEWAGSRLHRSLRT